VAIEAPRLRAKEIRTRKKVIDWKSLLECVNYLSSEISRTASSSMGRKLPDVFVRLEYCLGCKRNLDSVLK